MTGERLLGRGHGNLWFFFQIHPEVFMASEQFPKGPLVSISLSPLKQGDFSCKKWLSDGHHLDIS